jgi:hypothetical protein
MILSGVADVGAFDCPARCAEVVHAFLRAVPLGQLRHNGTLATLRFCEVRVSVHARRVLHSTSLMSVASWCLLTVHVAGGYRVIRCTRRGCGPTSSDSVGTWLTRPCVPWTLTRARVPRRRSTFRPFATPRHWTSGNWHSIPPSARSGQLGRRQLQARRRARRSGWKVSCPCRQHCGALSTRSANFFIPMKTGYELPASTCKLSALGQKGGCPVRTRIGKTFHKPSRATMWLGVLGLVTPLRPPQTERFVYTHEDMDKVETMFNTKCAPASTWCRQFLYSSGYGIDVSGSPTAGVWGWEESTKRTGDDLRMTPAACRSRIRTKRYVPWCRCGALVEYPAELTHFPCSRCVPGVRQLRACRKRTIHSGRPANRRSHRPARSSLPLQRRRYGGPHTLYGLQDHSACPQQRARAHHVGGVP